MTSEAPYRVAVLLILTVAMTIGSYHRLQAAKSGERFDRKQEGLVLAIVLRIAGLGLWFATFAYLINPDWLRWARLPIPAEVRWIGAPLGAVGCWLMYWTMTNLGKNLTDTVSTREHATLVTTGPYRWIRHPFYLTAFLLILSVTLLAADGLIGVSGLVVFVCLAIRTPIEERKLIEKFGDAYRDYMATTGRILPRLHRKQR